MDPEPLVSFSALGSEVADWSSFHIGAPHVLRPIYVPISGVMMASTTMDLEDLTRSFYREVDANADDVFDRMLTSTASFAFNDFPPVSTPADIAEMVKAWKAGFRSVEHRLDNILVDSDKSTTVTEITVKYTFHDGTPLEVKGCSISEYGDDHLMVSWRVYVDTSKSSPAA